MPRTPPRVTSQQDTNFDKAKSQKTSIHTRDCQTRNNGITTAHKNTGTTIARPRRSPKKNKQGNNHKTVHANRHNSRQGQRQAIDMPRRQELNISCKHTRTYTKLSRRHLTMLVSIGCSDAGDEVGVHDERTLSRSGNSEFFLDYNMTPPFLCYFCPSYYSYEGYSIYKNTQGTGGGGV